MKSCLFFSVAVLLWYFASRSGMGSFEVETYPLYQRIVIGSYCLFTYIFRFLAPVGLLHFYDYPIRIGESLPYIYYIYLLLVPFLFYGVISLIQDVKNGKLAIFSISFTVVTLLLVLHIIPSSKAYMAADRYMYLPIIGLAMLLVWITDLVPKIVSKYLQKILLLIMILTFSLLCLISNNKAEKWQDSLTLKKEIKEYLDSKSKLKNNY